MTLIDRKSQEVIEPHNIKNYASPETLYSNSKGIKISNENPLVLKNHSIKMGGSPISFRQSQEQFGQ